MDQDVCALSFFLYEVVAVIEECGYVAFLVIDNWNVQVFNVFGYFVGEVFSFDSCDDSADAMFYDRIWITFEGVGVAGGLDVADKDSATAIFLGDNTADIFSKCSIWVHHFRFNVQYNLR